MSNAYQILYFLIFNFLLLACASDPVNTGRAAVICSELPGDLDYIYNSVQSNLSIYQFDQDIRSRSDNAYISALEQAKVCSSEVDYVRIIRYYFASFHDPHIQPWWRVRDELRVLVETSLGHEIYPSKLNPRYVSTGIILKKIGDGYYIRAIDSSIYEDSGLAVGDELKTCDHQSSKDILKKEIIPFEQVSSFDAGLYRHVEKVFFRWDKDPEVTSICEFDRKGLPIKAELKWRPVGDSYLKNFAEPKGPIYSIESTSYGHWVTLRSLAGYGEGETAFLKAFVDDAKKLRRDKAIVLDLRDNGGGNSSWGQSWIKSLYGYLPPIVVNQPDLVYSSAGNIKHFERLFELLDKSNGFSKQKDRMELQNLLAIMRKYPNQLIPIGEKNRGIAYRKKPRVLFHGKIYVVTDAGVFSSGELFLQSLRLMPGVTQVGIASDASTLSGDIRFDQTPSGIVFSLGTKIFQSLFIGRKPGEPLVPQVEVMPNANEEFLGKDSMREQIEVIVNKSFKR